MNNVLVLYYCSEYLIEDRSDNVMHSFYEELGRMFIEFSKIMQKCNQKISMRKYEKKVF
jgi:hypothetical protein